jgi:hypothetical protein
MKVSHLQIERKNADNICSVLMTLIYLKWEYHKTKIRI